jgi:hypothetical protein
MDEARRNANVSSRVKEIKREKMKCKRRVRADVEASSDEGISTGLIDTISNSAALLAGRNLESLEIHEALKCLCQNEDVYRLIMKGKLLVKREREQEALKT